MSNFFSKDNLETILFLWLISSAIGGWVACGIVGYLKDKEWWTLKLTWTKGARRSALKGIKWGPLWPIIRICPHFNDCKRDDDDEIAHW